MAFFQKSQKGFGVFALSMAMSFGSLEYFCLKAALADALPPNDLHLQDNLFGQSQVSEKEFFAIIGAAVKAYDPLAARHNAKLSAYSDWNDPTVNASASRQGNRWYLNFFGGMARRPEITKDGFALVVCHEIGHHFGGFPFKGGLQGALTGSWAATEGQADYFATQACARKIWQNQWDFLLELNPPTEVREGCAQAWDSKKEQDLCERIAVAGMSVSKLVASLKQQPDPDFANPDSRLVGSTQSGHANPQCRLDTFWAGTLCGVEFSRDGEIPGQRFLGLGQGSKAAEAEAYRFSCSALLLGSRPLCWFKPRP